MKKIAFFLSIMFFMGTVLVYAQTKSVTGTVTSAEDNQPIPGVSVSVKGTTLGTVTNLNGVFEISVPKDAKTLVFSFIGMKTAEVEIGLQPSLNISLLPDVFGLDEVIVAGVAAGTPKRKMSVSVSRVGAEDLQEVPATSAATALQGKVAGVSVVQSAGNPGRAATIVIRGAKQLVGSQNPLIIVDGVMVDGTLSDINVEDIESFEVVKGASASALYGSRAANGVIVITSKNGSKLKEGEVTIKVRNEFGVNRLSNKYDLATHHQYVLADDWQNYSYTKYEGVTYPSDYIGGYDSSLDGARKLDYDSYMDNPYATTYDLQDEMFPGNNFSTNYISIESNTGKTAIMASFENSNQGGIIKLIDGYKRQNFRFNLTQKITDKLSISASNLYIKSSTEQPGGESAYNGGIFFNLLLMQPDVNLYLKNADGQPYQITPDPWNTTTNPLYPLWKNEEIEKRDRLISAYSFDYAPLDWLSIDGKYAFEYQATAYHEYEPYSTYTESRVYSLGSLYMYSSRRFDETAQATLNMQRMFGDLTLKSKFSYIYERRFFEWHNATGTDFAFDVDRLKAFDNVVGEISADNETTEEVTKNGLGILSADFKGKYILDGMFRMDGSSLFGSNERWAPYYRVSGAWRIAEDFKIPGIQELKLRAAYGTSGQRPGFSYQYEVMSLSRGNASKYLLGNEDLKPAQSTETEVGLNVEFLKMFDFESTYSKSITTDQFVKAPQAVHAGGWQYRWINGGTIETNVFEATLGANIVKKSNFSWNARLIFDKAQSKITKLDVPAFQTGPEGQEADKLFYMREGEVFGTMYGYHFLTSLEEMENQLSTGKSISDYEINSDGYVVPAGTQGTTYEIPVVQTENGSNKLVKIGDATPDFNVKFSTNLTYKDFQFYMLWDWKQGGDIYNKSAQWLTRDNRSAMMDQFGKPENQKKTVTYYQTLYFVNEMNDFWVEDGTYLKLREMSLYYNLGEKKLSKFANGFVKGIKIGVIGRNLLTFTKYTGYDPEVQTNDSDGAQNFSYDFMGYPNYRSYSASLEIKF